MGSCFARHIFFQIGEFEFDWIRNSSGRTRIQEYSPPPPPPISVLLSNGLAQHGRNLNVNWGGGVYMHIFMFCPTDFFSNRSI